MAGNYTGVGTLEEADKAVEELGDVFRKSLLEFGVKVRDDERRKAASRLSLLETIAANVDNGGIDDKAFREFVRNSLQVR